jgi:dienelactone hydrolase
MTGVWTDRARDREVPWLIRLPHASAPTAPVVVFSHGLGGSREGGARLSQHLASHGYAVVHIQHPGSDISIWGGVRPNLQTTDRTELARRAGDPRVAMARFRDVPFAVSQIRAMARDALAGRLDSARMAMTGHSYGALTTQVAAGQIFAGGASMPVDDFSAFVAMSPSGDRNGNDQTAFAQVNKPFMCLTGTEDSFALNAAVTSAADRLRVYAALPPRVPAVQVVLTGGDHFVFDGRILTGGPRPMDARHQAIIDASILAFLDGHLRDDRTARAFLREGLAPACGPDARIDWRAVAP